MTRLHGHVEIQKTDQHHGQRHSPSPHKQAGRMAAHASSSIIPEHFLRIRKSGATEADLARIAS